MCRTLAVVVVASLLAGCGGSTTGPDPDPTPTTGALVVQVQGLPNGVAAAIQVSGPGGFAQTVNASTTLNGLTPGSYQLTRGPVASSPYSFAPAATSSSAQVSAGASVTAAVAFAATTGAMLVTFSGLPGDVAGAVTVAGPGGFSQQMSAGVRLDNLVPGSYTVTPTAPGNVGLQYRAGDPAPVLVAAGATANRAVTWALPIAARSAADRADGAGAALKVMYLLPSDGIDRQFDTDGTIHRTLSAAQRWLATQLGGRAFRLDLTAEGALDITFVRLQRSDATYAGYGITMRDSVEKDLVALGHISNQALYLAYYDGVNTTACGSAPRPPAHPGRMAGIYLKGTIPGAPACATNPLAASAVAPPGYFEFVTLHEVLHLLGVVDGNAPNHAFDGHVGHDPGDLMYAGVQAWTPSRIDQQRANYYSPTGLPGGLVNLAQSAYLLP